MAYSANVSFHGVSRIEIGEVSNLMRDNGKRWKAVTMTLFDASGHPVDSIQFHADEEQPLSIAFAAAEADAA